MADQCIVCLENLDTAVPSPQLQSGSSGGAVGSGSEPQPEQAAAAAEPVAASSPNAAASPSSSSTTTGKQAAIDLENGENHDNIAVIQSFHLVQVYDKVGGSLLSTYKVEDKKQVVEFDPQAWLDENQEEEEDSTPCPVCNSADHEDVLLLCDGCDTPYHTHCIGLDSIPRGSWFCMECVDLLGPEIQNSRPSFPGASGRSGRRNDFFPRTLASMRRARNRARSDEWQGAWGQISGAVFDAINLDLDSHDGDDALEEYRRSQQLRERERREYQRWQQRLNIASRLGARDVFERSIQEVVAQPVQRHQAPPSRESREERRAWGALERARECETASPGSRKRKSRSITASPIEPAPEPERRLKRPRTRRVAVHGDAGPSKSPSVPSHQADHAGPSAASASSPPPFAEPPSFLSSLLKEVEMSTPSDDENIRNLFAPNPHTVDPSSPATSPAGSAYNSPRALSITPPPYTNGRSASPTLSLSSHIEPVYPPANYSPTRASGDHSDSEQRSRHNGSPISELRQPRPRRQQPIKLPRSQDASPTRPPLSLEMKENISSIVRSALKPHWKSSQLTPDQYATINRDVSRKLYEEVTDPAAVDDEARKTWEKIATNEVARAVASLKA
ncbi:Phd and ring finger domain protein [Pleurostoma richardsiae]|uniref:Phd and ring finger domain protein n=1 Tax=Pleurostoma richardsiae TaxID=41990 RepID=A0AA38RNJ3_9PEZI|nr:Phd and ring finger domain protein [Pleurostoma richardsiae]